MLNGTLGDIIILRYKTQNRNRMTKSKTKQGMPEICINCKFAASAAEYLSTEITCTLTKKKHSWEYSCKKWREME